MSVLELARPELLGRKGYIAALGRFDLTRLHANELPQLDDEDNEGWTRYPPPRPVALTRRLSQVIDVPETFLLVTRGSNEGIDLLMRAFCRAGLDSVITCPPTFGMYRVCAEVQGASVTEVPLDDDFDLDVDGVTDVVTKANGYVKLVFLCSPANPTGAHLSSDRIEQLCQNLTDKALVVLDQAYIEFCDNTNLQSLCEQYENLAVLRTFSKAYGLAGLRCGLVIANPSIINLLDSLLPPYSTPTPTIDGVLNALSPRNLEIGQQRLVKIERQKQRLLNFLERSDLVSYIYPSDSNFVLARVSHAQALYEHIHQRGILVRSFVTTKRLENCLRITVGNELETTQLFAAFEEFRYDAYISCLHRSRWNNHRRTSRLSN